MKVLYIHQYFSTPEGATGTRSYEFAKHLVNKGHEVTVLCGSSQLSNTSAKQPFRNGVRRVAVEGINIIEIDLSYSNYDSFFKRAWKFLVFSFRTTNWVRKVDYDVLYATSTPLTVAIPGIVMKAFRIKSKQPYILEIRDLWPELPREMKVIRNKFVLKLLDILEKQAYKYANFGVGLSPGICQGLKRFGSLQEKEVEMIPNGCDNLFFESINVKTSNEQLNQVLTQYQCAVFTGAHGVANGLDAIINAAVVLQKQGRTNIKIVFVGDGKMKPHLMEKVKSLKLENCYFFDPISKKEMPYVLSKAVIGLMTLQNIEAFYYGTSPNKFFDYIAAGLPVINNYPGWVSDMIQEYQCGVSCEADNNVAFADAITHIVDLPDQQLRYMKENSKKLAQIFDRDKLADKFLKQCEVAYAQAAV